MEGNQIMCGIYNIEINIDSLEKLETQIKEDKKLIIQAENIDNPNSNKVLFRGQENSTWKLQTTLERYLNRNKVSFVEYSRLLRGIHPPIASYTGKEWAYVAHEEYCNKIEGKDFTPQNPLNYQFMVYLRQHGFPSPLLDWTESLYIALFFAYQHVNKKEKAVDISIFMFFHEKYNSRTCWEGDKQGTIFSIGPNVNSHARHFRQQCDYTVGAIQENEEWFYYEHEKCFVTKTQSSTNTVCKYNLPSTLKYDVMKKLNDMNINAYTLFSNEESLMEHLANTLIFHNIACREELN